ncbi:amidohydrolase family protein [Amycolatopsis sp. YIM 10]|uniref:amidohydrolase family protein n=1 Tax=Amycolatopsis sp. YIM 10 TaxID=2653857 RepID=UPI00129015E5|nr:amidohydrolase family protein [Amycolatopsis sp. YIM 10]QFU91352.1 Amidohydrolase [Amycolatopsis sp. YIM 10]
MYTEFPLVDHHCHGVVRRDLDRHAFEALLTEAPEPSALGGSLFDSRVGLAVRRWCAPVLGLETHASADEYLERRGELGHAEVDRRFLGAAGLSALLVDTGFEPEPLLGPAELGALAGAPAHEIVRLEQVAEQVLTDGVTAAGFAETFRTRLAARTRDAVGVKSIAAYRTGLDLAPERPSPAEVTAAAGRFLRAGGGRLADEVLHRFAIWCGVDLGLPVQFHIGLGDPDVRLRDCDPLLLMPLLRALQPTGIPLLLLHNYPFHREAGYLAQVFGTVFVDIGLAAHNLGDRAGTLLAELTELAPFGKVLYSSDAFGLPELYFLAATLFRRALDEVLAHGTEAGSWTTADAGRFRRLVAGENARRVYFPG